MQRLWLEGKLSFTGKRPLDVLREEFLADGDGDGGYEAIELVPEDIDPNRAVLFATWTDPYRDGTKVRALLIAETPDGGTAANWLLAAVCDKTWSFAMQPLLQVVGLMAVPWCNDPSGMPLSITALPFLPSTASRREEGMDQLVSALSHPDRRTAVLVAAVDLNGLPDKVAWPGMIDTVIVDEAGRRALNRRMPMSQIPVAGARLFTPACDGLPDTVIGAEDWFDQRTLSDAVVRMFAIRRATALPDGWSTDPVLVPWWQDPMTTPTQPLHPEPAGSPVSDDVRIRVELDEARQALTISQRRTATAETALRAQAADNDQLRARLAGAADEEELARLRAQLRDALAERDLYADELEHISGERDDLLRIRGILTAELATHVGDRLPDLDTVPEHSSFADLLHAATRTFSHLVLTADPAPAAALDGHAYAPVWRRKTWNALATLDGFTAARARRRAADLPLTPDLVDVRAFAAAGGPGASIASSAIALRETDTIVNNNTFHQARCFPVRPDDRTDRAFFGAHIRIGAGAVAPRLHFLDSTSGLIVGYIGPHLPNPGTARI